MSYWIIHREQVSLNLQIEEVESIEEADKKRNYFDWEKEWCKFF